MVKAGLIPKLVELLKRPPYRARGLRLLYHMSIDDRCKAMFAYTDVSFCCPCCQHHKGWFLSTRLHSRLTQPSCRPRTRKSDA